MTSSRNFCIYNRVITINEVIFKYIEMSKKDIVYHDHVIINSKTSYQVVCVNYNMEGNVGDGDCC